MKRKQKIFKNLKNWAIVSSKNLLSLSFNLYLKKI